MSPERPGSGPVTRRSNSSCTASQRHQTASGSGSEGPNESLIPNRFTEREMNAGNDQQLPPDGFVGLWVQFNFLKLGFKKVLQNSAEIYRVKAGSGWFHI